MVGEELGERAREVLSAIVREYIQTGMPVGSHNLRRSSEFDVSTATLRNVMADLEALGYLEKPHTSAGRIPTDRGYRFFVDAVVRTREPLPRDRALIEQQLTQENELNEVLEQTSRMLHALSTHAGLVLAPRPAAVLFERIEFVRLRENRVLAILIGRNGEVQNRAVSLDFAVSSEELVRASNYLSELLHESPFEELHGRVVAQLEQEQALYDELSQKALKLGLAASAVGGDERVLIEGKDSFFESREFADLERIRTLFRALEEKGQLLKLLDRVQKANELQIYIGTESEFSGDVAVIASPYGPAGRVLGAVGVIGPTRMNYQRVIPLVNFTAQVLSRVLEPGR